MDLKCSFAIICNGKIWAGGGDEIYNLHLSSLYKKWRQKQNWKFKSLALRHFSTVSIKRKVSYLISAKNLVSLCISWNQPIWQQARVFKMDFRYFRRPPPPTPDSQWFNSAIWLIQTKITVRKSCNCIYYFFKLWKEVDLSRTLEKPFIEIISKKGSIKDKHPSLLSSEP
jgi:hypothetical protein